MSLRILEKRNALYQTISQTPSVTDSAIAQKLVLQQTILIADE